MGKYLDLTSVIDVEPLVSQVLPLIEDEDLQEEFWQRLDGEFFKDFVEDYCKQQDIEIMREVIEEAYQSSIDAD
jgi:hypothetical protein